MSGNPLTSVLRSIRQQFGLAGDASDALLLGRYAAARDESAFAALVERHGAMVWGTCRRIAGNHAEDAFQATWLVLARKAGSLRDGVALPCWLHRTAMRLALSARARPILPLVEVPTPSPGPEDVVAQREECAAIDEEVNRLPEKYRLPVLLCFFRGLSHSEAAVELGWPVGTVAGRLARAKDLLHARLSRRGLAPSAWPLPPAGPFPVVTASGAALQLAAALLTSGVRERLLLVLALLLLPALTALSFFAAKPARSAAPPTPELRDVHGDPLPDGALVRLGTVRYRRPEGFGATMTFTPKGDRVMTMSNDALETLDVNTGRRQFLVPKLSSNSEERCYAISRNCQQVAVAEYRRSRVGPGGNVRVRILAVDGKEIRAWEREKARCPAEITFSPDGGLLATLDEFGMLRVEDVKTGKELQSRQFPNGGSGTRVAFSPDGATLAVVTQKLYAWRWKSGEPLEYFTAQDRLTEPCFSPDSKILAVGHYEGVHRWDLTTGERLKSLTSEERCYGLAFSPDGKYLATPGRLWDTKTAKEARKIPGLSSTAVFSPDSRRIASAGSCSLRIWDVATGEEISDVESHRDAPSFVRLDGGVAMTAGDDLSVRFWDGRTGKQTRRIDTSPGRWRATAVSPDGRWMATSDQGKGDAVALWDLKTGKPVYRLAGHGVVGSPLALMFTPDGKRLASWGGDRYLRLWDVEKGRAVEEFAIQPKGRGGPIDEDSPFAHNRSHEDRIDRAAFSTDARRLALVWSSGDILVFDTVTGKQVAKVTEPACDDIALSPDGKLLLVSAWGKTREVPAGEGKPKHTITDPASVRLYELASGKALVDMALPGATPRHLAFRPDGKGFAVYFIEPHLSVRFFDVAGTELGSIDLPVHSWRMAYSGDGKRLVVSLGDSTCLIYRVPEK